MSDRDEHLAQALRNEEFAAFTAAFCDSGHLHWAATAMFYSAVHYGRAYLCSIGKKWDATHKGFESAFTISARNPTLFGHYQMLKIASEKARYQCKPFSPADILKLRVREFERFKDAINLLIVS